MRVAGGGEMPAMNRQSSSVAGGGNQLMGGGIEKTTLHPGWFAYRDKSALGLRSNFDHARSDTSVREIASAPNPSAIGLELVTRHTASVKKEVAACNRDAVLAAYAAKVLKEGADVGQHVQVHGGPPKEGGE